MWCWCVLHLLTLRTDVVYGGGGSNTLPCSSCIVGNWLFNGAMRIKKKNSCDVNCS
jgi:hypothetical protein